MEYTRHGGQLASKFGTAAATRAMRLPAAASTAMLAVLPMRSLCPTSPTSPRAAQLTNSRVVDHVVCFLATFIKSGAELAPEERLAGWSGFTDDEIVQFVHGAAPRPWNVVRTPSSLAAASPPQPPTPPSVSRTIIQHF